MGERVRLGTADGKERHWLYVCPECGTHTLDAQEPCDGFGELHDPTPFERVRIVDAADYDALDEQLAHTEKALKAAKAYIVHLLSGRSHTSCRRKIGPGQYKCGYLIDYEEALATLSDHGREGG